MAQSSKHFLCRGTTVPISIFMTVLCLFLANDVTHAREPTTYLVGDEFGWDTTIPMDIWTVGKTFYAGDILEFKYDAKRCDVAVVNQTGYENCKGDIGTIEYVSGHDKIKLPCGYSYYIANYNPEDCKAGLKMAINALAPENKN